MRAAAALCVLAGGILVALLFRNDLPPAGADRDLRGEQLVLRNPRQPPQFGRASAARSEPPPPPPAASEAAVPRATILSPTDPGEPPPALARDYPGTEWLGNSGWGPPIQLPSSAARDCPAQTHKIVDGDTLEALAERYLGSAERSVEIYEANRDVLPGPRLLPIGAELTIPLLRGGADPMPDAAPWRPLVPISPPDAAAPK